MNDEDKILLILDLDETLIHASEVCLDQDPDFKYENYFVYIRPGLANFLKRMSAHFELAIWSSADDIYVSELVEKIKPDEVDFQFVWSKSRCTLKRNYKLDRYINEKRLKKLKRRGYRIERMLIVDDSPEKVVANYGNAIYIMSFEGDKEDCELEKLSNYLISMKDDSNVRTIEKRWWRLETHG